VHCGFRALLLFQIYKLVDRTYTHICMAKCTAFFMDLRDKLNIADATGRTDVYLNDM
jgi:hypothetical protein